MKRLTIAVGVGVALVGACTRVSTPTGPTSPAGQITIPAAPVPTTTQTTITPPPFIQVNEEARDGPFGFTIFYVGTMTRMGRDDNIYPQGVFVQIAMVVENIGKSQQTYFADYQRLTDSQGRLFSPDRRMFDPERDQVDINPGNRSPSANLLFDVPKGTQPSQYVLWLHASPNSAGVAVRLPDSYDSRSFPPTTTGR